MEILISVAAKISEYAVAPIGRQMGYMFSYTHNFQKLADQLMELEEAKGTIQRWLSVERRNGKEIEAVVLNWLDKVDEITKEGNKLCEDPYREKVGCSKCSFPNLWQRHQLSRKAKKVANNVAHVLGEGKFHRDKIEYLPAIGGVGSTSAKSRFVDFESRMSKMNDIMQALTDPKVSILGVYGLGGIGKSTLVEQVAEKAKSENLFDEVVMASVTQNVDLKRIQCEIADQLSLQFTEESVLGRAYRLRQRINIGKSILIILDDIWEAMKLEEIGIPYRSKIYMENREMESQGDHMGCKVLLISRNQDVLWQMETQKDFRLDILSEPETWYLFESMAGDVTKDASYRDIAIEVAKKCAGLPIVIVTVARALRHKGINEWKDAQYQLPTVGNKWRHEITYSALELSYNQLENDEVKALFLLCGVEGPFIAFEDLLKYAMGLGVFKHIYSLTDARYRLRKLISALKASCLLLEDDTDVKFIRMHDLVHEVAISIASRDHYIFIRKEDSELKEWPSEDLLNICPQIILRKCSIPKLPERLDCAELKFLHLHFANNCSLEVPDSIFEAMGELLVLDLTCMNMSSLPTSLSCLTKLQTLCLRECSLGDVTRIGALKNLKILNLSKSSMEELPGEIVGLTNLRMLDMSNSRIAVIPPNIISNLTTLEELYLGDMTIKWEVGNSATQSKNGTLAELKQLHNLTALDIHIQDVWTFPRDLMFEKLERYKISIGDVWGWFDESEASKTLKLKLPTSIHLEHGIKALIRSAESLCLDEINGISNVLYELNADGFPLLEKLHIQNNAKIQHIINSLERNQAFDSFPNLETMVLQNLCKLEKLCCGPLTINSLSKLKVISVQSCGQLKYLFSYSVVKRLSQLISIEVSECSSMQKVVFVENENGAVGDGITDTMGFCGLQSLTLRNLPKLDGLCSSELATCISDPFFSAKVQFPSLEGDMENLRTGWHCQFDALKSMVVDNCAKLVCIFPSYMQRKFHNLETLTVRNCDSVEVIFEFNANEIGYEEDVVNLAKLNLFGLPKLKQIWSMHPDRILNFPNLQAVNVQSCNLEYVFPLSIATRLQKIEELNVQHCSNMKEIVVDKGQTEQTVRFMFNQLTTLYLSELCEFKGFYAGNHALSCPSLKKFDMSSCGNLVLVKTKCMNDLQRHDNGESCVSLPLPLFIDEVAFISLGTWKLNSINLNEIWEIQNLTCLVVNDCGNLKHLFSYSMIGSLSKLKQLEISGCHLMEEIIDLGDGGSNAVASKEVQFASLEEIVIKDMEKLRTVWHCQFDGLKSMVIDNCAKLVCIFPSYMQRKFHNLKTLTVSNCESVKEIFELNANDIGCEEDVTKLAKLTLHNLPRLEQIWSIDPYEILNFSNLEVVNVQFCTRLKYVFPLSIATRLQKMRELYVKCCRDMEKIVVAYEGQMDQTVEFRFTQLTTFCLSELCQLRGFYVGSYNLFCQSMDNSTLRYLGLWQTSIIEDGLILPRTRMIVDEQDFESRSWQCLKYQPQ